MTAPLLPSAAPPAAAVPRLAPLVRRLGCAVGVGLASLAASAPPAAAQQPRPGVDMATLLNIRFFPGDGGFSVDDVLLLFPPADGEVRFALTDPAGRILHEIPFEVEPSGASPVFAYLEVNGRYGRLQSFAPGQPGAYTMSVTVDGEPVGSVPFTLAAEGSADPFSPGATWSADGPWRTLAYLAQRTDRPEEGLKFEYWTSMRETGGRRASIALSLRRGGQEVGRSRSNYVVSSPAWQFFDHDLVRPGGGHNPVPLTPADLAAHDGPYDLVLLADGQPVKTYAVHVEGGQLRPHPRSAIAYEPRGGFLSPRLMKARGSGSYTVNAWWVEVE